MALTIHASKDGHIIQTLRLGARVTAERARALFNQGWNVHVTDQAGRHYSFDAPEGLELSDANEAPQQADAIEIQMRDAKDSPVRSLGDDRTGRNAGTLSAVVTG
jgi:hypothetical protein